MILSFHPCFAGDRFINCGGRQLTDDDLKAIRNAWAVILPQACRQELYQAAVTRCGHVFPNFDAKFTFPGKTGQIDLFRRTGTPHPETRTFSGTDAFYAGAEKPDSTKGLGFPLVMKLNGADEGHGVFLARTAEELEGCLRLAAGAEKSGETGFLLQRYIETGGRVLRVCVIYKTIVTYWRVSRDPADFRVNLSRGAAVDQTSFPTLRERGAAAVEDFCRQTGVNLAGFDLVFPVDDPASPPLFLEINYYFGRRGLGGTENYYRILTREIEQWLTEQKKGDVRLSSPTA